MSYLQAEKSPIPGVGSPLPLSYLEEVARSGTQVIGWQAAIELYDYTLGSLSVNIAVGPSCPVRCEGCYNFFGNTRGSKGLITAAEVIDFVKSARPLGIGQVTLFGGDPLHHPEIIPMVQGLSEEDLIVKLDTVGTSFLGKDVPVIYKGFSHQTVPSVDINAIAPYVDFVSTPLDGSSQSVLNHFRRGRTNLFEETLTVAGIIRAAGVPFGINTVANAANVYDLPSILHIAERLGASVLQVFEYDPEGPNPSKQREALRLWPGQFAAAAQTLTESKQTDITVECKPFAGREGAYFLVQDNGMAHRRKPGGGDEEFGHITHQRTEVLEALNSHVTAKKTALRNKTLEKVLSSYGFVTPMR